MKYRLSFITNSSSTCFLIKNNSEYDMNFSDFIDEIIDKISEVFSDEVSNLMCGFSDVSPGAWQYVISELSKKKIIEIDANKEITLNIDDSESDILLRCLKYLDDGKSNNFEWNSWIQ